MDDEDDYVPFDYFDKISEHANQIRELMLEIFNEYVDIGDESSKRIGQLGIKESRNLRYQLPALRAIYDESSIEGIINSLSISVGLASHIYYSVNAETDLQWKQGIPKCQPIRKQQQIPGAIITLNKTVDCPRCIEKGVKIRGVDFYGFLLKVIEDFEFDDGTFFEKGEIICHICENI